MVYCFLADGFEEIEAIAPIDILRRAGIRTVTFAIGASSSRIVTGAHGIPVVCDASPRSNIESNDGIDAVILPGGMPGAKNLAASSYVNSLIDFCALRGKLICAICAAPLILGRRGLLNGVRATCFPGFEDELEGAVLIDAPIVRDGQFLTARGAGCAVEFGLAIVECLCGDAEAAKIKAAIQCP